MRCLTKVSRSHNALSTLTIAYWRTAYYGYTVRQIVFSVFNVCSDACRICACQGACLVCACRVCMSILHVAFTCQYECCAACQDVCPQRSIRFADAIQNGESSPTGYFPQAPIFPLENAGEFRPLRRATRGSASGLRKPLKRLERNFNAVRAGCVAR